MDELSEINANVTAQLRELADTVAAADGVAAFGDAALIDLARKTPIDEYAVITEGDVPVAFAWCDGQTAELAVHPDHRRRGLGTRLLAEVRRRHPNAAVWAHGHQPAAAACAERNGLRQVRELWMMRCDLSVFEELAQAHPEEMSAELSPPPGLKIRSFTDDDAAAWLELNAAAFAAHPEQGQVDAAQFAKLRSQSWWQPHLLRLLENTTGTGPELAGFIWLKPHAPGVMEIYVVGVHPDMQGQHLGRLLVREGIMTAVGMGAHTAILYVDAADEVAVRLYSSYDFRHCQSDVQYVAEELPA